MTTQIAYISKECALALLGARNSAQAMSWQMSRTQAADEMAEPEAGRADAAA